MKNLADYIHGRGLKFGVYTARCRFTCQLFAASFGHEAVDAKQWAEWGVRARTVFCVFVCVFGAFRVRCCASSCAAQTSDAEPLLLRSAFCILRSAFCIRLPPMAHTICLRPM